MQAEWDSIAARVDGLSAACPVYFSAVEAKGSDYYAVSATALIPLARAIYKDISSFRKRYENQLPPSAMTAIDDFLSKHDRLFSASSGIAEVGATAVALAAVRTTVATLLVNREARARSITDRAFAHLQRTLVADPTVRATWLTALAAGEVACERLGACHLLLHGIWAFKLSSTGERTDLVFGDPLQLGEAERSSPTALVLTEWKVAQDRADVDAKLAEAQRQASLYAAGSLSDLELTTTRYAVVVTKDRYPVATEMRVGDVIYRQIVLAVDPSSPSVSSRAPA